MTRTHSLRTSEDAKLLEIHGISKAFGEHVVLDDVSLQLQKGDIALLVGANGSGKSTLIRSLVGLVAFRDPIADPGAYDVGRDPADVEMTHLSTTLVGADDAHIAAFVEARRPRRRSAAWYAASVNAGTVDDHVGRFRELAEAGAAEVVVRLPDLEDPACLERFARVISAFR